MFNDLQKLGNIFFIISFLLFLFIGYLIFEPFIGIITVSTILTIIFYPVHIKIYKIIKNEIVSSLFSTVLITITLLLPFSLVIFFLVKEIIDLYPVVSLYLSDPNLIVDKIKQSPFLYKIYQKIESEYFDKLNNNFHDSLVNYLKQIFTFLFNFAKDLLKNIILLIVGIFIMAITIFFLLKDGKKLYQLIYSLIPLEREEKDYLFNNSYLAIQGVLLGAIFVAIAQSLLALVGFWIAGMDYSIILAVLTFFASFIPFGGASLIWIPVAIYLFFSKGTVVGLMFFLYGTFVISTVDNIIRPIVVGSKIDIHPLILFFAILGGLKIFGFLGIFIAPVAVAVIDAFILLYKKRYIIED